MRAALYARVSTLDQPSENQLDELRRHAVARGWTVAEYVDDGVSGAKASRPALDRLMRDAKRRRFDVVVCWSLDRLGRSLKHLIVLLDGLQALGVGFVSVREGLDWNTPAASCRRSCWPSSRSSSGPASSSACAPTWPAPRRKARTPAGPAVRSARMSSPPRPG